MPTYATIPINKGTGEAIGEAGRAIRQRKTAENFKAAVDSNGGDAQKALFDKLNRLQSTPIEAKVSDANGQEIDVKITATKTSRRKLSQFLSHEPELAYFAAHYEDIITNGEYMGRRGRLEEEVDTSSPEHKSKYDGFHYWKQKVTALVPEKNERGEKEWKEQTEDVIVDVGERDRGLDPIIYAAKRSSNSTFEKKEQEIRKHAKKISGDHAESFGRDLGGSLHDISPDGLNIGKIYEIVNIRFEGTAKNVVDANPADLREMMFAEDSATLAAPVFSGHFAGLNSITLGEAHG